MKGTRGIVALLTCMTCASAAAAQTSQEYSRVQEAEQQRVRKAEVQAEAKARATQQKRAARGARPVQRGGQETTETVSRTVRLERGGTFDLWNNTSGDVTITGTGGSEAKIEAIKVVRAMTPERARAQLDALRVDIAERGGNVEVRSFSPSQGIVRYVVTLPENTSLILRTASGNLHVQNMAGDEITANTISGNVVARDLRSRVVDLHTVLGNMNLQDMAAQRALLQSTAGKVEYAGRFLPAGRYQFQTHGGDITVTPSGGPGFDLEATTFRGGIRSNFDLKRMQEPPAFRRGPVQKTLRGTVGDAGAMLTVTSFSGNIVIVKP